MILTCKAAGEALGGEGPPSNALGTAAAPGACTVIERDC